MTSSPLSTTISPTASVSPCRWVSARHQPMKVRLWLSMLQRCREAAERSNDKQTCKLHALTVCASTAPSMRSGTQGGWIVCPCYISAWVPQMFHGSRRSGIVDGRLQDQTRSGACETHALADCASLAPRRRSGQFGEQWWQFRRGKFMYFVPVGATDDPCIRFAGWQGA